MRVMIKMRIVMLKIMGRVDCCVLSVGARVGHAPIFDIDVMVTGLGWSWVRSCQRSRGRRDSPAA